MSTIYLHGFFDTEVERNLSQLLISHLSRKRHTVIWNDLLHRGIGATSSTVALISNDPYAIAKDLNEATVIISFFSQMGHHEQLSRDLSEDLLLAEEVTRTEEKLWIPVIFQEFEALRDSLASKNQNIVLTDNLSSQNIADEIIGRIENYFLTERRKSDKQEKLEKNVADFVDPAIKGLEKREKSDKAYAISCYGVGLLALMASVVLAFIQLSGTTEISQSDWIKFTYITVKTTFFVGLALAVSRYAFILGNSFMNEARRIADRIHAIRFGEFYLRAYGDTAKWEELKEVFQHWNIDNESHFATLDADKYAPKMIEMAFELAKVVVEKRANDKE